MKKKSNSIKDLSIFKSRNSIFSKENDISKNSKDSHIQKSFYSEKTESEKEFKINPQDEITSNAYKNIITVISNLLDNIEDQKKNGKSNFQYIQDIHQSQKKLPINKKPVKKLISYTPLKSRFSLNNINRNIITKNRVSSKKLVNKYNNKNSEKDLNKNQHKSSMKNLESYNLNSSINIGANIKKDKGYLFPKKSSKKKVKPIFF